MGVGPGDDPKLPGIGTNHFLEPNTVDQRAAYETVINFAHDAAGTEHVHKTGLELSKFVVW